MRKEISTHRNAEHQLKFEKLSTWLKNFITIVAVVTLVYASDLRSQEVSAQSNSVDSSSPSIFYGKLATKEEKASSIIVRSFSKCSGTIVSEYVILTALHCVQNSMGFYKNSSFGFTLAGGNEGQPPLVVEKIVEIGDDIIPYSQDNDKAAIILKWPLRFNENVHAIMLGSEAMLGKYPIYAVGHGLTDVPKPASEPIVGEQEYQPRGTCGPPFGYSIVTKHDGEDPDYGQAVTYFGDSGGRLHARVPADDPNFPEGDYMLGITEGACGLIEKGPNNYPLPNYSMKFQSIVKPDIAEEVNRIIEEAPSVGDRNTHLPSIMTNDTSNTFIPYLSK